MRLLLLLRMWLHELISFFILDALVGSSAYRSISHINSCVCCFIGFIGAHFSDNLLLVKPPWRQLDSAAAPTSLDVTAVHLSCVSLASALLIQ